MEPKELQTILENHKKWLNNSEEGVRANLQEANLQKANLRGANLRWANLQGADLQMANLQEANLQEANLQGADLQRANLQKADLQRANLQEANLDYSYWPLWCGSLNTVVDKRLAAQLAYHFCRLDCDDPEYLNAKQKLKEFANQFHRVKECGTIL